MLQIEQIRLQYSAIDNNQVVETQSGTFIKMDTSFRTGRNTNMDHTTIRAWHVGIPSVILA